MLEDRTVLSAGPREEFALELLNRMRANPAAELPLLLNSNDPAVNSALHYFAVNQQVLAQQWASLTPAPPLAWNDNLAIAASAHSQLMNAFHQLSHQLPGELDLKSRIQAAGYDGSFVGENCAAGFTDMFPAHAAFAIDWGPTPTGMQNPPGHRENMMNAAYRDVGIGVIDEFQGAPNGPLYITQEFGSPNGSVNAVLVGAVFTDKNGDGFYSLGEGVAGVTVTVAGASGSFTTTTSAAGGYQLALPADNYTVTFSGGGLAAPIVRSITVGADNVLLDINTNHPGPPPPAQLTLVAGAICQSDEYYSKLITSTYQHYLSRTPEPAGLASWLDQFDHYGLTDEKLEAGLIGSAEYIANHGGNGQGWVIGMYHDLLGRTPDAAGLGNWLTQLQGGVTPESIAYGFAASAEREGQRVLADYQRLLGRTPTPSEVSSWVDQFVHHGVTNERVMAGFVASAEYFQDHHNDARDWLFGAYQDMLGRSPTPAEVTNWLNVL
jgi:hypothetical protein